VFLFLFCLLAYNLTPLANGIDEEGEKNGKLAEGK
jgi:hypothetical protein